MDTDTIWQGPSIQADEVTGAEVPDVEVRNGRGSNTETLSVSSSAPNMKSKHRCVSAHSFDNSDATDAGGDFSETSGLLNSSDPNPASNQTADAGHCHDDVSKDLLDKRARNKLILASLFCLVFMIAEAVSGLLAGSLAIVSDAAHLLTDFASFLISLLALYLRTRPATKKLSFGWYRAEILGALMSILVLWVLTGILVYSAVERVISRQYEINAEIMLITAAVGVAFNLTLGFILHQHVHTAGSHGHSHTFNPSIQTEDKKINYGSMIEEEPIVRSKKSESNINVTAAFIHVLGDLVQSIGVLIAAFIIYFKPDYKIADPICTFVFSAFVLVTTMTVLRDILVVLMEGTPRSLKFSEVRKAFFEIRGVKDVHNLRVWSLTLNKTALSVHIAIEKGDNPLLIIKQASQMIKLKYGITETTMQIEEYIDEMLDCTRCQDLKD